MILKKIISGGQTGADRAGLEAAKYMGLLTGGTAPKRYITENGPDLSLRDEFGLTESPQSGYGPRTRQNVIDSDGTVIFGITSSPGSRETIKNCHFYSQPFIENPTPRQLVDWILKHRIQVLNCAGNRASKNPQVAADTIHVLTTAITMLRALDEAA